MILISIILGGRLFGVIGILLAIPFAAIFDFVWKDYILKKLELRKAKKYNIQYDKFYDIEYHGQLITEVIIL